MQYLKNNMNLIEANQPQTNFTEECSHLVINTTQPTPIYFKSLKAATDWSEEQVKINPSLIFKVFQLRADIVGHVDIKRKDYLGASLG